MRGGACCRASHPVRTGWGRPPVGRDAHEPVCEDRACATTRSPDRSRPPPVIAGVLCPAAASHAQAPPARPAAPAATTPRVMTLTCGADQVTVTIQGEHRPGDARRAAWARTAVRAASGVKYEVEGDATTSFWNKGAGGTLTVKDKAYPECMPPRLPPGAAGARPFTAGGNEPAWSLTIAAGNALTLTDQGATTTRLAKAAVETTASGRKLSGSAGGKPLVATVLDTPCADR